MELYALNGAFYTQQMLNPMSTGQIALWHALVYIANKSRWPDWFTVAGITLVQLSGLSHAGVKKARNELKQRGMIDFRPNGTRATSYRIVMQESSQDGSRNSSQDSSRNSSQDSSRNSSQDGSRNSSALRKQNNTLIPPTPPQGETPDGGGAVYVENNLRGMSPNNWEELRSYLVDGLTMDVICHAVDEAAANGKRNWAYVRKILNRYLTSGITTVEQAKASDGKPREQPKPRKEKYCCVIDGEIVEYEREVPV